MARSADQSGTPARVGYDVTITRHEFFDGMGIDVYHEVDITRLSDGERVTRKFDWRWRARRFARSRRRIGKEFERWAQHRAEEREHFTLEWT